MQAKVCGSENESSAAGWLVLRPSAIADNNAKQSVRAINFFLVFIGPPFTHLCEFHSMI